MTVEVNKIDAFLSPWTGQVQRRNPSDQECADLGIKKEVPDFAINERWYAITVHKSEEVFTKDENGVYIDGDQEISVEEEYLTIENGSFFWGDVTVRSKKSGKFKCADNSGMHITFWVDEEGKLHKKSTLKILFDHWTGDYYRLEAMEVTRMKCLESILGVPFHVVGAMAVNTVVAAISPFYLTIHALVDLTQDLFDESDDAWDNFRKKVSQIPSECGQNVWNIIRPIIYGIPNIIALAYGVIHPLEGKAKVNKLEALWKQPYTFRDDIRYLHKKNREIKTFFLDWCFQQLGNIYEEKDGYYKVHIEECKPIPTLFTTYRALIR